MKIMFLAIMLATVSGCAQMVDYGKVTNHKETFEVIEVKGCSGVTGSCYLLAKYPDGKERLTAVKDKDIEVGDVMERNCKAYEKMQGEHCDRYWHKASN